MFVQFYLGVFMAIHFVMMCIWIWQLKTNFCERRNCEPMFVLVMALIWSFCFLNIKVFYGIIYYSILSAIAYLSYKISVAGDFPYNF